MSLPSTEEPLNSPGLTPRPGRLPDAAIRLFMLITLVLPVTTLGFELDSDQPIRVSADSARLDDSSGTATYTGEVEVMQGETRLTADHVTLHRDEEGLTRIEASGKPAHYRQPATEDRGETDASAEHITYSAPDSQLIFERNAVIEQGDNLFRGDRIEYDTARRVVNATSRKPEGQEEGDGRVEMVIQPRSRQTSP